MWSSDAWAGLNSTVASSVAKLTEAVMTPGTDSMAVSFVSTHVAHVIPMIETVVVTLSGVYPESSIAP